MTQVFLHSLGAKGDDDHSEKRAWPAFRKCLAGYGDPRNLARQACCEHWAQGPSLPVVPSVPRLRAC